MRDLDKILQLTQALLTTSSNRKDLVHELQEAIWKNSDDDEVSDCIETILLDLAYDLDYYEADSDMRAEDPSFYGDDRLKEEISNALINLKTCGVDIASTFP